MLLTADIEARLRKFDTATSVEVRENGVRVATIDTAIDSFSWELRGAAAKPVLAVHSEQFNITHRIVGISSESDEHLTLSFERFGKARPGRIEFLRVDFKRAARKIAREEFRFRIARVLAERFPDETLESPLSIGPDLEHSISGNYARGVLRGPTGRWALLAVPDTETPATSTNSLTFGLLWLSRVREMAREGYVVGLKLIVAKEAGKKLAHLAKALSSSISLEVYEFEQRNESLLRVEAESIANRDNWLVACRARQVLLDSAAAELAPIVAMAPKAIALHPDPHNSEIILRFRGLAFARWENHLVFFGRDGDLRRKLTPSSHSELKQLLHDLETYRHQQATNTRHPLYRAQPERWLETVVRSDVTRIDPRLDPRFVYTQLFANSATERGILDILAVTTTGRLAIIELKTSEHIHLPLQGADYWLRISRHLDQGDFQNSGYFPQLELQKAPPIVFLVAPALHFHSTTGQLLRHLSSSMEVACVGLAESWRRGLRVVMRQ
ncbi:MAG: hypothetical protein JO119_21680 [Acidobacteria bacterium]|nr:hypothetical protein [Acidobacteriota bacterium]